MTDVRVPSSLNSHEHTTLMHHKQIAALVELAPYDFDSGKLNAPLPRLGVDIRTDGEPNSAAPGILPGWAGATRPLPERRPTVPAASIFGPRLPTRAEFRETPNSLGLASSTGMSQGLSASGRSVPVPAQSLFQLLANACMAASRVGS